MENLDIRDILPLLRNFGIGPEQLGPEKLEKLMKISQNIKNPSEITPEISRQIFNILGIQLKNKKHVQKKIKIGRNQLCPCGKGIKYKKCCGIFKK